MTNSLDINLLDLGWKDLICLAEFYDKQSTLCRARAKLLESTESMNYRESQRVKMLWETPQFVANYMRKGHDLAESQRLTAEHLSIPLKTVQTHWQRWCREKTSEHIRERNRLILHLVTLGATNAQIGKAVGLHSHSVSRIVGQTQRLEKIHAEREENRNILFFTQEKDEKRRKHASKTKRSKKEHQS